ncbi:DoxX family protein [Rubrivirga sp.]|uniref:DoxX family protein n=1 Tax=Rubrivirga sp. TaxID=1885344 RepID=UPI003B518D17
MKIAVTVVRYLLGLMLLVLGLNGFLNFIPQPAPPAAGGEFLGALVSGGVMPVVKVFEVVIGALLLAGRFVPLALVMLVPIAINIVLYHVRFDVAGGVGGYVVAAMLAFLLWAYRGALMPLLVPRAEPLADRRALV